MSGAFRLGPFLVATGCLIASTGQASAIVDAESRVQTAEALLATAQAEAARARAAAALFEAAAAISPGPPNAAAGVSPAYTGAAGPAGSPDRNPPVPRGQSGRLFPDTTPQVPIVRPEPILPAAPAPFFAPAAAEHSSGWHSTPAFAAVKAPAVGSAWTGLADESPFIPASSDGGFRTQADGPGLELRGIMTTSAGPEYCIYDVAKKRSVWAAQGENGPGFVIISGSPSDESVTLDCQGRRVTLALRVAEVLALGQAVSTETVAADSLQSGDIASEFGPAQRSRLTPEAQAALVRLERDQRERTKVIRERIRQRIESQQSQ